MINVEVQILLVCFGIYASKVEQSKKEYLPKGKYLAIFISGCMVKSLTIVIFNKLSAY